ncbi:hypothetical protein Krad_4520 (plasmid) [Kineococcus radiotolerans SRS30216 = ATCC BAA-149]|uniref:Uncharacterized protein n=1 Tax=Kineococcus radiotolerans (strain ATCC BAA-149 / DSM 14245 / SRS30216) TaxID=266940 RepID=A6WGP0_KINRD|nr:hypothetical protein Krad_4520 [Kineococcus radiotolerans SRS30216 = ATCC BAA-149]
MRRQGASATGTHFPFETPLKEPPLVLACRKRPVVVSRLSHMPALASFTWVRLSTAPARELRPVFLAMTPPEGLEPL